MTSYLSTTVTNAFIQHYLDKNSTRYSTCMEQLSSGTKFTNIGSNPVDFAKSSALNVQINFNTQIQSNITNGKDLMNSAQSYQNDILTNIQRIQDLATQAANETYTPEDKDGIITEIQNRLSYINYMADTVNFNGKKLLDGSSSTLNFKIGIGINDNVNVGSALIDVHTTALGIDLPAGANGSTWTTTDIGNYINSLNTASTTLTASSSKLGSFENRLDSTGDNLIAMKQNLTESKSIIADTDIAATSADMVRYQILQEAATSVFVQTNQVSQLKYSLFSSTAQSS